MITKTDLIIFSVIAVFIIATVVFWKDMRKLFAGKTNTQLNLENDKNGKKKNKKEDTDTPVKITQRWEMPEHLKEISGIAYINNGRFACVQDEVGKIFIFNTGTNTIEKEIPFAASGDYEGIAIVGSTAYILRADGKLFEVNNYLGNKPAVIMHTTHLTEKHDVEGLCYDKKNNRLLLAIKENEQNTKEYKGIYAFDIESKKLAAVPVHKIYLSDDIWKDVKNKDKIKPSDLEVHPSTGDLYILDGPESKLLVMGANGAKKNLYQLNTSEFPQPEGISFTETGDLYISNEGKGGTGNILKVLIEAGKPVAD